MELFHQAVKNLSPNHQYQTPFPPPLPSGSPTLQYCAGGVGWGGGCGVRLLALNAKISCCCIYPCLSKIFSTVLVRQCKHSIQFSHKYICTPQGSITLSLLDRPKQSPLLFYSSTQRRASGWERVKGANPMCLIKLKYEKVGVLRIRIVKSDILSVGPSSERNRKLIKNRVNLL